jgi:hypothetical protein
VIKTISAAVCARVSSLRDRPLNYDIGNVVNCDDFAFYIAFGRRERSVRNVAVTLVITYLEASTAQFIHGEFSLISVGVGPDGRALGRAILSEGQSPRKFMDLPMGSPEGRNLAGPSFGSALVNGDGAGRGGSVAAI